MRSNGPLAARLLLCMAVGLLAPGNALAGGLGVYPGNDTREVARFEQWLGCRVDQILVFTDQRSWGGIANPRWFLELFEAVDRPAIWSVSMIPENARLEDAASGRYNQHYISAARVLAAARPLEDGHIYIRLGWEFNGDWFPWAAQGREAAFIATFRHVVDSFRRVSPLFRFEWNFNYGQSMDPMSAYPGDAYVDVIGMDFYWKPEFLGHDSEGAFARIEHNRYGLRYLRSLGQRQGKPIALSEWGVQSNDAAPFIARVHEWIRGNEVLYHNYWDSDADYQGRLSGGRWPSSARAFRQAFCPAAPPR